MQCITCLPKSKQRSPESRRKDQLTCPSRIIRAEPGQRRLMHRITMEGEALYA